MTHAHSRTHAQVLNKLMKREGLSMGEAQQALSLMLDSGNSEQLAAFLVLLQAKGASHGPALLAVHAASRQRCQLRVSCAHGPVCCPALHRRTTCWWLTRRCAL